MADEIVNRVKESGVISMDLGEFKPNLPLVEIDIAKQLWQQMVLREKDFRAWVKDHVWEQYHGKAVYVHCSVDAIIPTWAYMLIGSRLALLPVPFVIGNQRDLEKELIRKKIDSLDTAPFADGRIIIKGCSDLSDPAYAMTELVKKLQPVAKSIMYGEPCSAVPVFKRK